MKRRATNTALATAVALTLGAGTSLAAIQSYNSASGDGGVGNDHPGFGFFQFDPGLWDTGLDASPTAPPAGEFSFAGSDGAFHTETRAVLNQGVTGKTGDHAGFFIMDYNPAPPATSFGTFWFGGIGNDAGPFPKNGATPVASNQVLVYGDAKAPAGAPMQLRAESNFTTQGNGWFFNFTGTGAYQQVGGPLSLGTTMGSFDFNDPQIAVLVAFGQGNELAAVDNGSDPNNHPTVWVDNLTMTIAQATWNVTGGGTWSTNSNWTPIAPDGGNAVAVFGNSITAPSTVSVDRERFAGTLRFDSAQPYTIGGTGTLNLRAINTALASGTFSAINAVNGSHSISAPLVIWGDTTVTVAQANATVTASNVVSQAGVLTKAGPGNFAINNLRTSGVAINAGTVTVLSNGGNAGASKVATLSFAGGPSAPTAALDLNNNDAVVTSTSKGQLEQLVRAGRNDGAWTGRGITSTAARTNGNTTFGILSGAEYTAFGGNGTFSGQSYAATDTLLKYTWNGDANFSGNVDFDDYVQIDVGFNGGFTGWANGDFDYSGTVDFDDYVMIDVAFNAQSGVLSRAMAYLSGDDRGSSDMTDPSLVKVVEHFDRFGVSYASSFLASVPDPSGVSLLSLAGVGALARRRRRQ